MMDFGIIRFMVAFLGEKAQKTGANKFMLIGISPSIKYYNKICSLSDTISQFTYNHIFVEKSLVFSIFINQYHN